VDLGSKLFCLPILSLNTHPKPHNENLAFVQISICSYKDPLLTQIPFVSIPPNSSHPFQTTMLYLWVGCVGNQSGISKKNPLILFISKKSPPLGNINMTLKVD
jgi:hypothetical protein